MRYFDLGNLASNAAVELDNQTLGRVLPFTSVEALRAFLEQEILRVENPEAPDSALDLTVALLVERALERHGPRIATLNNLQEEVQKLVQRLINVVARPRVFEAKELRGICLSLSTEAYYVGVTQRGFGARAD